MNADDLERIIAHLDTLYEVGDDCIHPDTGVIVSDGEYDALRRELKSLRPNSTVFNTATASKSDSGVKKIKHDPPMTSISKASHEDRDNQEQQLFKWMADAAVGHTSKSLFDLGAKTVKYIDKKTQVEQDVVQKERTFNGKVVTYPRDYFYQTYKLDGVALGLYYEKGKLVAAGLRPRDGVNGEDVTEQVKYVSGIPQTLKQPITCSIRGELICKLSDFEEVQKELAAAGEQLRANPRNHAAGGIRQFKDPTKVKDQRLSFVGYAIEGLDNPPYKTEYERAKFCNKELGVTFVRVETFNFYQLQTLEENVKDLDYEVDGVVIGVNNLEDQEQLGRHGDAKSGNPKGKIAWKFAEERATPSLKMIEWNTGRTGAIKPVAIFDQPVSLAGTQVRRATLHNLGFIFRNEIGFNKKNDTPYHGTTLIVLKAGKIIPKVVGVAKGQVNYTHVEEVPYSRICPSCGATVEVKHTPASGSGDDMYELICPNKQDCPAQNINTLLHYLKTFGVLGLGESTVTDLVEYGAVKVPADFYKLTIADCKKSGLSERESLLAIAGINMISAPDKYEDDDLAKEITKVQRKKKTVPLWKLFAAFGIESAGKSAGKALTDHFGGFDAIRKASVEELEKVGNIGTKTAELVCEYLKAHKTSIDELLKFVEPELPKTGPLTGQTFVLTGGFAEGKKHWEALIEGQGGKCGSAVSKTTNYVIEGADAGSKADKAKTLGIPLIDVNKLKKILNL